MRKLGIDLPMGMNGGPVLDGAGRLVGLASQVGGGPAVMLPVSKFRDLIAPNAPGNEIVPVTVPRMQPDEAYERALKVALQVITRP